MQHYSLRYEQSVKDHPTVQYTVRYSTVDDPETVNTTQVSKDTDPSLSKALTTVL